MPHPIPFLSLQYQHQQIERLVSEAWQRVYGGGNFILGAAVEAFEKRYASYHQVSHCVGVANGLDALFLSLIACGVEPGDEVIVPAHTYLATWLAVTRAGGKIVPVEPDEQTCNMDANHIGQAITPRTKVIVPVHLYGQPCNMTAIMALATKHSLKVVEDNAQAHGAHWQGQYTGTWGDCNATSFYPTKNLGALGDGGAITTHSHTVATFLKQYRNYGLAAKNVMQHLGINSRLDELQAAFLMVKLENLDTWNVERRRLAQLYHQQLKGIDRITLPVSDAHAFSVYHLYVIRTSGRDALKKYLADRDIETAVHYPLPPHLQQSYRGLGFIEGSFPIAERIADTCLSLPLWPGMTDEQIGYVCDAIRAWATSSNKNT